MKKITEIELCYAAEFKVIKSMRLQETSDHCYQIYVVTADDPNEKMLVTAKGGDTPREWSSLDRLIRHIRNKYRFFSNITLLLYNREKKGDSS